MPGGNGVSETARKIMALDAVDAPAEHIRDLLAAIPKNGDATEAIRYSFNVNVTGRHIGLREMLRAILRAKFGRCPTAAEAGVDPYLGSFNAVDLVRLGTRIATASSLAELGFPASAEVPTPNETGNRCPNPTATC